jgi:phosphoglycolate phosphatase
VNATLAAMGARPLPEAEVISMVGEGARVLVERALAHSGLPTTELPKSLERFLETYNARLLDHTRPYDGVAAMLGRLRRTVTMAVLTNKPSHASTRVLEGLGLDQYFQEVIGGDGEWPRKPDPTALLHLVDSYGPNRENALMVGDSRIDLKTARNAGVACCLVRYGFGFTGGDLDEDVLIADNPEAVADITRRLFHTGR